MSDQIKMMAGMAKIIPIEMLIERLDDALAEYKQSQLIDETDEEKILHVHSSLQFACIMITMNMSLQDVSHEQMAKDLDHIDEARSLINRLYGETKEN